MQVFKTFFKIAKKHFAQSLIYLFVFLIISIMVSSNADNSSKKNFTASSINISIIDKDNSFASNSLKNYLEKKHHVIDLKTTDKDILQDNLYQAKVDYILFIEKNFEKKLLSGNTNNLLSHSKLFDSTSCYFAQQQIDEYIRTVTLYTTGGYTLDEALKKTTSALLSDNDVSMVDFENKKSSTSDYIYYYFQYLPYVLISMLILGLAPILISFRKKDIENRMNCSALTLKSKNFQLTFGCIIWGFIIWLLFLILCGILAGFNFLFSSAGLLCILNNFMFFIICIAITLLISAFSVSKNVLNMLSNIIGLGMSFLCGIFVPQWLLGSGILVISRFLPAYWYIKANNMISGFSGETMSYASYWKYIGIEALFFVAIFSIYLVASKQRKNKH